jgi:hypothetical protein
MSNAEFLLSIRNDLAGHGQECARARTLGYQLDPIGLESAHDPRGRGLSHRPAVLETGQGSEGDGACPGQILQAPA